MTKEQGQLIVYDLTEQLQRATKYERAIKERTDQIARALQQSEKDLEAATAKRENIEAQLKDAPWGRERVPFDRLELGSLQLAG
jgi:uncharacterized sporulation protein YeaH/YhbH (DUF444 family)